MSDEQIRQYAQEKGFRPSTLERWLSWAETDKDALFGLAGALRIGENHVRDLIDWLEEISLRDGTTIREILAAGPVPGIQTDPRLGRADKLKRIKEQIRRVRFPRLSATEDLVQTRIRDLGLKAPIKLTAPPGLEGGRLYIEFHAASHQELRELIGKLAEAAKNITMTEIFALLRGEAMPGKETVGH